MFLFVYFSDRSRALMGWVSCWVMVTWAGKVQTCCVSWCWPVPDERGRRRPASGALREERAARSTRSRRAAGFPYLLRPRGFCQNVGFVGRYTASNQKDMWLKLEKKDQIVRRATGGGLEWPHGACRGLQSAWCPPRGSHFPAAG